MLNDPALLVVAQVDRSAELLREGRLTEALDELRGARLRSKSHAVDSVWFTRDLASSVPQLVDELANRLVEEKLFQEAAAAFEWGLDLYPADYHLTVSFGWLSAGTGRYERAISLLRAATRGPVPAGGHERLLGAVLTLASAHYLSRDVDAAIGCLSEELESRAWTDDGRERLLECLDLCRRGVALFATHLRAPPDLAFLNELLSRANELLSRGLVASAREVAEEARAYARRHGQYVVEAHCLHLLGGVDLETGNAEKAVESYEGAAALFEQFGQMEEYLGSVHHGALAFAQLGDVESAAALMSEVLRVGATLPDLSETVMLRYQVLGLRLGIADPGLPESVATRLCGLVDDSPGDTLDLATANLIMEIYELLDPEPRGIFSVSPRERLLRLAARTYQHAGAKLWEARAQMAIGGMCLERNRLSGARSAFVTALAPARVTNPMLALQAYESLGDVERLKGRPAEAARMLQQAVEYGEEARSLVHDDRSRERFFERLDRVYRALVSVLLDLGRTEDALTFAERTNARVLAEQLGAPRPPPVVDAAGEHAERYDAARRELDALWASFARGELPPAVFDSRRLALQRTLRDQVEKLMRLDAAFGHHVTGLPPDWRAGRAQLADDAVYLFPFFLEQGWVLFVVGRSRVVAERVRGDADDLRELAREFARGLAASVIGGVDRDLGALPSRPIERPSGLLLRSARALFEGLVAPVRAHLAQNSRVTWIPDAGLVNIPPAAFHDGARYLAEIYRFRVGVTIGLDRLLAQRDAGRRSRHSALLVGDPDGTLPSAANEARYLAAQLASPTLLLGADATLAAIKRRLPSIGLLHCACHAVFVAEEAAESFLSLAPRDGAPERLTGRDLFRARTAASLLVLSACQSARAADTIGNERHGLVRAALYSGASGVLSALWPVSDTATMRWMKVFYRHARNSDVVDAIALTQRELLEEDPELSPGLWAPFQLVGVGGSVEGFFRRRPADEVGDE